MINNSFDTSKPLFTPKESFTSAGLKPIKKITNNCIVTYSNNVRDEILNNNEHEVVAFTCTANAKIDIYYLKKLNTLFYMSPVTAPAAVAVLEEVSYITGAKNFIFFGSCGVLVDEAKDKVVIPTKAYRDEGTSYHYMAASDFIDIKNYSVIEEVCKKNNIGYVKGYTWTTDAIYRETVNNIKKRKKEGCICVEMEVSALEAASKHLNLNFYTFLITGDILSEEWDRADLGTCKEKHKQLTSFDLATLILKEI